MDQISALLNISSLVLGLGVVYASRFLLRRYPKMTGSELESVNSEFEGIHRTYLTFNFVIMFIVSIILFLIYRSNQAFWESRVIVLFVPVFATFALSDAFFALRTKVFPTSTRYNWNSYVYDANEELRWVAFWQIGLSMILMIVDGILFIRSL